MVPEPEVNREAANASGAIVGSGTLAIGGSAEADFLSGEVRVPEEFDSAPSAWAAPETNVRSRLAEQGDTDCVQMAEGGAGGRSGGDDHRWGIR